MPEMTYLSINNENFYLVPAGFNYNARPCYVRINFRREFWQLHTFGFTGTSKNQQILQMHH